MAQALDYYEILKLAGKRHSPVLDAADVKAAYRKALLHYHPDKKSGLRPDIGINEGSERVAIDDIVLAFKTLSDRRLRSEYDKSLNQAGAKSAESNGVLHRTGLDTVDLDDLIYDENPGQWTRSCRCGDDQGFIVTESQLEAGAQDGEVLVGCRRCSLWLRVLFAVDE